jgi:diguanylate cyclase (GGDEF)-like protein/PAS domain S-box-containing protein
MELPETGLDNNPEAISIAAEQADQGIVLLDSQLRVRWINRAAERLCGWRRRHAIGKALSELVPEPLSRHFIPRGKHGRSRLDALLRYPGDIQIQRSDSSNVWVSLSLHKIPGTTLRVVYLTDIQIQRNAEARSNLLSIGFDQVNAAILITDAQARILHVNRGLRHLLGYSDTQLVGQPLMSLVADNATPGRTTEQLLEPLFGGQPIRSEVFLNHRSTTGVWCEINANPVFDGNHQLSQLVVVMTDISEARVHAMLLNRILEAMAREVPTNEVMHLLCTELERIAPDILASVVRIDNEGRMRPLAGPSLAPGYMALMDGVPIGPSCGSCGTAAWSGKPVVSCNIATDPNWEGIAEHALRHGLAACWSTPVEASDGRILGTFGCYYRKAREPDPRHLRLIQTCVHLCAVALERDISRQRIHHLAYHDSLTGLPNRSQLIARANQALAAAEHDGHGMAVMSLDIERFKQVNEVMGQGTGDNLLREIALRIQSVLGAIDIAGRLSGDEFALVIAHCNAEQARSISQTLLDRLQTPLAIGQTELRLRAGIGISLYPDNAKNITDLMQQADLARMQSKLPGATQARFYSEAMDHAMQQRRALEIRLRQALPDNSLQVHYQPQVNLYDGTLHSVEALTRWEHPELGSISPDCFIPLAEECGVIGELGMWVINQACSDLRQWREQGLQIPAVSVNLSPTDFRDPALPTRVKQRIDSHGLQAADLVLEITEVVLLDRHPDTLRTLRTLAQLGVRLSLDDFGTGYSSFNYLRELPVSEIKLDQSFVADLGNDPVAEALAEAVCRIGVALKLAVVAEGVTTTQQIEKLRQLGFTAAQGFHYSCALQAPALALWLQQHHRSPSVLSA